MEFCPTLPAEYPVRTFFFSCFSLAGFFLPTSIVVAPPAGPEKTPFPRAVSPQNAAYCVKEAEGYRNRLAVGNCLFRAAELSFARTRETTYLSSLAKCMNP
jgi:hypothetical protein